MIWLVVDLPLWKMMEFVSWDDDIPNIWKNKKVMFQTFPNHPIMIAYQGYQPIHHHFVSFHVV